LQAGVWQESRDRGRLDGDYRSVGAARLPASTNLAFQEHDHSIGGIIFLDDDRAGFHALLFHLREKPFEVGLWEIDENGYLAHVGNQLFDLRGISIHAHSRSASAGIVSLSLLMSGFLLHLGEILMDELDDHGAFADARSHALDGPVPHIAHRENAGNARLQ